MADDGAHPAEESTTLRPWPVLAAPAYHGLAGDLVRAIEPASEADPVAILVQFVVAFGSAMNRGLHFRVEAAEHCANLFAVIVGPTSKGRKGTSQERVMGFMRLVDDTWAAERVMGGLASGEGLIFGVRDPVIRKQPIREGGRVTGYQDVVEDPGVTDKRLLVTETELAKLLRVMKRESSTVSAQLRQAWDTGQLRILTKNSPLKATGAHVSVIAHISATELRAEIQHTELANGFLNRFLIVCARRSKCLPEGGTIPRDVLERLARSVRDALDFARRAGEIHRDDRARARWAEIYPELSSGHPGLLGAVISRAEAQVTRLACVYAVLDRSVLVKIEHLEAALALWRYCEDSARFVFGESLGDPVADKILEGLRKAAPAELGRTQISRDILGGNEAKEKIDRGLRALHEAGLAEVRQESTAGPARQLWGCRSSNSFIPTNRSTPNGHSDHYEVDEIDEIREYEIDEIPYREDSPPEWLNQEEHEIDELLDILGGQGKEDTE